MSAEHIRHWRIGDVEVARIVEVNAFEDDISMLLKDETAEFVKQHELAAAALRHGRGADEDLLPGVRAALARQERDDRHLHRRGSQARIRGLLQPQDELPARTWRWRASPPRASTRCCARTCTSIMSAGTRSLVNGRWVPTFPQARYLFGRQEFDHWVHLREHRRLPRRRAPARFHRPGRGRRARRLHHTGLPADRRSLAVPDPGAYPGSRQCPHPLAGRGGGDHRRPDASSDPARRPAAPWQLRHGQATGRAAPGRRSWSASGTRRR